MAGDKSGSEEICPLFPGGLRGLLEAVLEGASNKGDLSSFVKVCHSLAIPYVSMRLSRDVVLKNTLNMSTSDFAYDCIADLFAFSTDHEFPHFRAYFAAYPLDALSDPEVIAHLRRLVFSHVNQGLFRLYNQVDPSLARVIRNIKLAVQEFQSLIIVEQFGVQCLAPSGCDNLFHLPEFNVTELEFALGRYLRGSENVPFMLGKLALFLTEQEENSRIVSITSIAIVFRSLYERFSRDSLTQNGEEAEYEADAVLRTVAKAVSLTKERVRDVYAKKKNIERDLIETYFGVIEKHLMLIYSGDGHDSSLRELLKNLMPGMTTEEYRKTHRSRLEYLSRMTADEVGKMLKHDGLR